MSFQDEMAPDGQHVSPALITDVQRVCKEIRATVEQIGNACARLELLDPQNITVTEFTAASLAFQKACLLTGPCMQKMQDAMERYGG